MTRSSASLPSHAAQSPSVDPAYPCWKRYLNKEIFVSMGLVAIQMPKLGYEMETGVLASWLRKVGDPVTRGEALAEIETDKAVVEMESTASGTLAVIVVDAPAEVAVGTIIAWIDDGA
jgi:biotin carboxyl carrier protein